MLHDGNMSQGLWTGVDKGCFKYIDELRNERQCIMLVVVNKTTTGLIIQD